MRKLLFAAAVASALLAICCMTVYAEPAPLLTVTQATADVVANSEELKKSYENKSVNTLQRKNIVDQLKAVTEEDEELSLTIQLMQTDIQSSAYTDTATVFNEKAAYSVEQMFASIISAEKDLAITQQNILISQKEYALAKVRKQLGKISSIELENTKLNLDKLNQTITAKENSIAKAYMSLNEVMGATLSNRYSLSFAPEYTPMTTVHLDSTVGVALSENNSLKNLSQNMTVADFKYDSYRNDLNLSDVEIENLRVAADQAHRSYTSARTELESKVISAYKNVLDLESDIASAQITLTSLKTQIALKQTELAAGKTTQLELDKLNLQLVQQEENIRRLICDHYLKVKLFQNSNLQ